MILNIFTMWQKVRSGVYVIFIVGVTLGCTQSTKEETTDPPLKPKLVASPTGENSSLPYLTVGADNRLYLSWVQKRADTSILKYATWEGNRWSQAMTIAQGTDWFVNWADYPMIAANEEGQMLAHFLAKSSSGTYSYDVNITMHATDQWSNPIIPHKDGTPTEHGFVTMLPKANGSFHVTWLDGRNTAGDHDEHRGAMTLRTAILDLEGNLSGEVELDDRVCDCCQTGGAMTANGPVFVYRDRSELEVRDMAIVRYVEGAWTTPQPIFQDGWRIEGCPVNGPRVAALNNDLAVAWFSATKNTPQVKVVFSTDGGATFGEPIMIDNRGPLGRVDIVMLDADRAIVSWLAKEGKESIIKAQEVRREGSKGPSITIARSDESRGSGFPQIAYHEGNVWFAWTDLGEETSTLKVSRLSIE